MMNEIQDKSGVEESIEKQLLINRVLVEAIHDLVFIMKVADENDFIKRVHISIEQMRLLVRVGAFNFTGKNKKKLLWQIHTLINPLKKKKLQDSFYFFFKYCSRKSVCLMIAINSCLFLQFNFILILLE